MPATCRTIHTRFRCALLSEKVRQATDNNSQTHYAKGKQSHLAVLLHIVGIWFQIYLTPLTRVLFTFPSRYLFTVGCQLVFSLIQWSGQIRTEFRLHRVTWDTPRPSSASLTRLSRSLADCSKSLSSPSKVHVGVPRPHNNKLSWFRLFRFRSPLLTESLRFLFLGLLRCFTSPRFASPDYEFIRSITGLRQLGCPIRKSTDQCLLAAPRGLSQLTTSFIASWHQGIHHLHLVA